MAPHPSRRQFVAIAGGATAWLRVAQSARAESVATREPRAGHLKIGVASYSMREFTIDQALDMAHALHVDYMTFKDVHVPRTDPPEATRALRAKIERAGITIMGGGTITIRNDQTQIAREFEYARNAGFPLIFTSPEPAALDAIERAAKAYDIKVAIHNHGPEDKWWPRPQDAYAAVKGRDTRLGLCVDIGHTLRTGTDPVQACRECRTRLYDIHVKDLTVSTDERSETEVGRGVVDIPALFRTLVEIGYSGQVGLEYEINARNPLPGMIESLGYMRGVLAAVETSGLTAR